MTPVVSPGHRCGTQTGERLVGQSASQVPQNATEVRDDQLHTRVSGATEQIAFLSSNPRGATNERSSVLKGGKKLGPTSPGEPLHLREKKGPRGRICFAGRDFASTARFPFLHGRASPLSLCARHSETTARHSTPKAAFSSYSMGAAPYVSWARIPKPGEARKGFAPTMLGIEQILRS